jgi:PAS domain-containing protein
LTDLPGYAAIAETSADRLGSMKDMDPKELRPGEFREYTLTYHNGVKRHVLVVDEEVPFPEGKLIVSRTDPEGMITHANEAFVFMSGFSEAELIGMPHYILRHPDMPRAAFKDLWDTVERARSGMATSRTCARTVPTTGSMQR